MGQGKYILKRIGLAFMMAVIILSLTFILMKLLPAQKFIGDVVTRGAYYDGEVSRGYLYSSRYDLGIPAVDKLVYTDGTEKYYYQVPVMEQYVAWLENILLRWDWGVSTTIQPNVDALVIIGHRLVTSMKINIFAVLFSVPTGIALGVWAALKKNSATDHIISTLVMVFISVPSFVLITFLMLILCYKNAVLPTQWPNPTDTDTAKFLGYILPVFCLSFGSICGYCRFVRAELCEVMESEYLLLARTKGLTRRQAIVRHALRNALVPIFPSILAEFIGILGGSMILERLYGIPGIGQLFIQAVSPTDPDYNVLFVDMAVFTTFGLVAGVFLDVSYSLIDPRIRVGAKK